MTSINGHTRLEGDYYANALGDLLCVKISHYCTQTENFVLMMRPLLP